MQPSQFPKEKRPPTIFNKIGGEVEKRTQLGEKITALHIGDTYLPLPTELTTPYPGEDRLFGTMLNRYSDTMGDLPLRQLLLDKVIKRNHLPVTGLDCIQVTNGATGVLASGFSRLVGAGNDVLTLAPYWTILRIVADQARVNLVEVPFFCYLAYKPEFDLIAHLEKHLTPATKAIYINNPSNPTGMVLNRITIEKLARFAQEHDLWVFSDEAYEDFIWDKDSPMISIGSLEGMFERTISVYTFSKCFGASGLRVGYGVAPAPVVAELNRGVVGSIYQVGRYDQLMAWRGMMRFETAVKPLFDNYVKTWEWVKENLKVQSLPSLATFYFFIYLGDDWKGLSSEETVNRFLNAGVVLSPGDSFGNAYDGWARLCFTIEPPNEIQLAIEKLNSLLSR